MSILYRYSMSTNTSQTITCGICRSNVKRSAKIYQDGVHFGIVCSKCHDNIPKDDLELMANMFTAYGGYFGKLKSPDFSLYKMLKELISEFDIDNKLVPVDELNIKMMHRALLYGITPQEFIRGLEIILEE